MGVTYKTVRIGLEGHEGLLVSMQGRLVAILGANFDDFVYLEHGLVEPWIMRMVGWPSLADAKEEFADVAKCYHAGMTEEQVVARYTPLKSKQ